MPRQRVRRAPLEEGDHKRLKLVDPDARVRAPTFHEFKDHSGQDAVSIWPFDPEHATQHKDEDSSVTFKGPQGFSKPWPNFAIQVYTVHPLSDDLSEFLSPIVRHGRRSFRSGEWEPRDAEISWRIDVYKQPLHDVYACIAHHKREIAHRSNATPSVLGGGPIHLYGKQANRARIIVLDPPDWTKSIVLASFAARDRVPEQYPYELDLALCAVDNVDGDNAMNQAIQEWVSDSQREPWRLEASEQHSNPKPPEEPRITTIQRLEQQNIKGTVEGQDNGIVCVKLRTHEVASKEARSVYPVFHLESAELDSGGLGNSLLNSLTPYLPPDTAFDLLIHPPKPRIDACLEAFHALEVSDAQTSHARVFAVIDRHEFVEESGILFVRLASLRSAHGHVDSEDGKMVTESLPLSEKWNNEHAMTGWRAYDVKRAALEFADSALARGI
ncbi:hypothetical protein M436DRAFT_63364 [Aureobasidium namibiae CBS 147.97]|uniref:Uncharacterized protein n=1 Tax=Aureobasidium namibiae CBS 147.97 TaxID=1043004 RepID=A0A074WLN5_9PEZI